MENAIVLQGWEASIITTLSLRFKFCSLIIPLRNLEQANESSYLNWRRCFLLSFYFKTKTENQLFGFPPPSDEPNNFEIQFSIFQN